jgi:hypothetical protein
MHDWLRTSEDWSAPGHTLYVHSLRRARGQGDTEKATKKREWTSGGLRNAAGAVVHAVVARYHAALPLSAIALLVHELFPFFPPAFQWPRSGNALCPVSALWQLWRRTRDGSRRAVPRSVRGIVGHGHPPEQCQYIITGAHPAVWTARSAVLQGWMWLQCYSTMHSMQTAQRS